MRKDLRRVNEQSLHEALTQLRYVLCHTNKQVTEWRRHQFHLFIRKGKGSKRKQIVTLSLHEDITSSLPPFHRARHKGKLLELEMHKIKEAYQRRRAAKT